MPVDTSMYNALGARPKSIGEYSAELDMADLRKQGMQQNALALQTGQMGLQDRQRAMQEADTIRNALAGLGGNATDEARINALKATGLPGGFTQADALQKSMLDRQKTTADIGRTQADALKTQLAAGLQKFEIVGQVMSGVRDQATYDLARQQLAQTFGPEIAQNMPPTYDPAVIEQNKTKAMSVKDQMAQRLKQIEFEQRQANDMLVPDPRNPGKFMPNQPLINAKTQVAQAGASAINNYGSPVAGVDAEGKPVFFQPTKTGGAPSIVPGVRPAPKEGTGQPTEDERKAAGYAIRMEGALKKLEEVGTTNPEALKPGVGTSLINMAPEGVANYMRSEARQRVETAQVDALDAALTLATGAAYTKEQLKGLSRSYFTQPGDDPATIKDKEQRLAEVIETARIRAGRAAPAIDKMGADRRPVAGSAPVKVTSDADYNALKPGTRFVTPDGKTGTKR